MSRPAHPPQLTERPARLTAELFGLLGPPSAWMATLLVSYVTTDLMCDAEVGDTPTRIVLAAVSVLALAVVVGSAMTAASVRRRETGEDPVAPVGGRRKLLATVGLLLSWVFGLAIVMTLLSALFAEPC